MPNFMRPYEAQTYALLRIVTGFLFLWHGMEKLFGYPEPMPPGIPPFIVWIAGCGAGLRDSDGREHAKLAVPRRSPDPCRQAKQGEELFSKLSCSGCHDGSGGSEPMAVG